MYRAKRTAHDGPHNHNRSNTMNEQDKYEYLMNADVWSMSLSELLDAVYLHESMIQRLDADLTEAGWDNGIQEELKWAERRLQAIHEQLDMVEGEESLDPFAGCHSEEDIIARINQPGGPFGE
jgi:hypothetical protein